jgi:hypothetical protein
VTLLVGFLWTPGGETENIAQTVSRNRQFGVQLDERRPCEVPFGALAARRDDSEEELFRDALKALAEDKIWMPFATPLPIFSAAILVFR